MNWLMRFMPKLPFEHWMNSWLQTEDLPLAENCIRYEHGKVALSLTDTDEGRADALKGQLKSLLGDISAPLVLEHDHYTSVKGSRHQAGTLRFGTESGRTAC